MTRAESAGLVGLLVLLGAGWGITQPLAKLAVSTGHAALGLVVWQLAISGVLCGALLKLIGRGLPLTRPALGLYLAVALVGTILPNSASYEAARHLPSGLISILLSTIPMLAFPIALALGLDRFRPRRLAGLGCGLAGVLLIVGPEASLPDPAMLAWVPIALIAPAFYAFEGNFLARWGRPEVDPVQLLCGASIVGVAIALPVALATGRTVAFPAPSDWSLAETALVGSSVVHCIVYASYFWMIGRAGPVFSAQVSYLVTGFGVLWAKLLLGESYSAWVWGAMGLMFVGLFLVQPRPKLAAVLPQDGTLDSAAPQLQDGPRP